MPLRIAAPLAGISIFLAVTLAAYAFLRPYDVPFMPHGMCFLWSPAMLWTNVAADVVTAASYFGIAVALAFFVFANRERVPFHWVVIAFGTFILACGATHVMDVVTLWSPTYWLSSAFKIVTATASILTAVSLPFVLPHVTARLAAVRLSDANGMQLVQQLDRAIGASHLKSEFVATMSHELRTPLNAIIGMAELLATTTLDERQRTYARTIDSSAESLLGIIGSILDFSKIEAGKLDLETRIFTLESAVAAAVAVLAHEARRKGLTIHCFVDPALPSIVRGDAGRLRQILLNLVGNAVKFTTEGYVVVRARPVATLDRHVVVRFEVQDTGMGISSEVLPQLFNPFVQGAASASLVGTGLGLSISKRLVELMHGEIGVTSEPGAGSLFWFTVRLGRSTLKGIARSVPGVRALLVSQDDLFLEIIARYVNAWGIPNRSLATPEALSAALESADTGEEHDWVVIADVETVDATAIRDAVARGSGSHRIRLLRVGPDEALCKPLTTSQLFDSIVAAMNGAPEEPVMAWNGVERRSV